MINESPLTKLARILVNYSVEVKEREKARIASSTASEPLLREVFMEVVRAGAHPELGLAL